MMSNKESKARCDHVEKLHFKKNCPKNKPKQKEIVAVEVEEVSIKEIANKDQLRHFLERCFDIDMNNPFQDDWDEYCQEQQDKSVEEMEDWMDEQYEKKNKKTIMKQTLLSASKKNNIDVVKKLLENHKVKSTLILQLMFEFVNHNNIEMILYLGEQLKQLSYESWKMRTFWYLLEILEESHNHFKSYSTIEAIYRSINMKNVIAECEKRCTVENTETIDCKNLEYLKEQIDAWLQKFKFDDH